MNNNMNYDPYTGQPLNNSNMGQANNNMNYDPYTGQPINNLNYNQYGSQPINNTQPKKKNTCLIVGIIFAALSLVGIVAIIVLVLLVYNPREAMTASDFKTYMESEGYMIQDAKNQFYGVDYIKNVYIAIPRNYEYQIEFYEVDEPEQAKSFYNNNKNRFETDTNGALKTERYGKNYSKYTLTNLDEYKVVSFIDNTAIYIDADKEDKEEIENILKEINY